MLELAKDRLAHGSQPLIGGIAMGAGLGGLDQLGLNLSYGQGGQLSFSEDYGYDLNGNLNGITDLIDGHNSQTMAYDGLNRLTEAHAPNSWGTEAYSYDPLNNMRGKLAANLHFSSIRCVSTRV